MSFTGQSAEAADMQTRIDVVRTTTGAIKHTCNDGAGPYFGRLNPDTCARCAELADGAERRTFDWVESVRRRQAWQASGRRHNCEASGCGRVCTANDW
jgi:hypothetical protein